MSDIQDRLFLTAKRTLKRLQRNTPIGPRVLADKLFWTLSVAGRTLEDLAPGIPPAKLDAALKVVQNTGDLTELRKLLLTPERSASATIGKKKFELSVTEIFESLERSPHNRPNGFRLVTGPDGKKRLGL